MWERKGEVKSFIQQRKLVLFITSDNIIIGTSITQITLTYIHNWLPLAPIIHKYNIDRCATCTYLRNLTSVASQSNNSRALALASSSKDFQYL